MKKAFFVLPLAALVLTACSSHTPAPVVNASDSTELPPSVMRPVPGTGAMDNSYGWQTDIQSTDMPATMSSPTYMPVPQPVPITQPSYQPPQPVYSMPAPQPLPEPTISTPKPTVTPAAQKSKSTSQDFTIPRDENNAPIYSQIDKGFYNGETYTVRKGDTMFLIAYITGKDVNDIAAMNNMSEPYQLHVGKVLKVGDKATQSAPSATEHSVKSTEPAVTYTNAPNGTAFGSDGTVTGPVKAGAGVAPARTSVTATAAPKVTASGYNKSAPAASSIKWQWPTQGRVIAGFSESEGGNKGLDIAGSKGQAVKAAASGKVAYVGNAIQGYGNIIIIKHNEDFLSAYAHNDTMSVSEQENVKAGQTIATLGSTGTNSNKLHFEIRYHGKPVDPTRYLPAR